MIVSSVARELLRRRRGFAPYENSPAFCPSVSSARHSALRTNKKRINNGNGHQMASDAYLAGS